MKATTQATPSADPAIPTIQDLADMRSDLEVVTGKIATAKGTFSALEAQRISYEAQLTAAGVDPAQAAEVLEAMKANIVAKNILVRTAMSEIKAALTAAEEVQRG